MPGVYFGTQSFYPGILQSMSGVRQALRLTPVRPNRYRHTHCLRIRTYENFFVRLVKKCKLNQKTQIAKL